MAMDLAAALSVGKVWPTALPEPDGEIGIADLSALLGFQFFVDNLVIANRVHETTDTEGTGAYELAGAVLNRRAFADVFQDGDLLPYVVESGDQFEIGVAIFSGGTLARIVIDDSSDGGTAIDWPAGSKEIRCDATARVLSRMTGIVAR